MKKVRHFTDLFNDGQMMVANLSLLRSTESQSLVGVMLVNAIYHAAKRRPQGIRQVAREYYPNEFNGTQEGDGQ